MRYHLGFKTATGVALSLAQLLLFQASCHCETAPLPTDATTAPAEAGNLKVSSKPDCEPIAIDTDGALLAESKRIIAGLPGKKRPKIGLALGGGGTRGAAHIGAIRVLENEGIPIDYVAGTSIGAIIGGLYCAGTSLDDIEKMIAKKSLKHAYYTVPLWLRVALVPFFLLPHAFHSHYDGLYRGNKFANFINKSVKPECTKIENLKIPFCAVASSLSDGQAHAIKSGSLGKAIQASSAIPILRRPVEIEHDLYVDGGIINNLPVDEVRAMGADIVIAVDVDEKLHPGDLQQFKKIGSVGNRVINMILCRVDDDQIKSADILIHPDVDHIKLLSLNEKDAYRAMEAGKRATKEAIDSVRKAIIARSIDDTADSARPTE